MAQINLLLRKKKQQSSEAILRNRPRQQWHFYKIDIEKNFRIKPATTMGQ